MAEDRDPVMGYDEDANAQIWDLEPPTITDTQSLVEVLSIAQDQRYDLHNRMLDVRADLKAISPIVRDLAALRRQTKESGGVDGDVQAALLAVRNSADTRIKELESVIANGGGPAPDPGGPDPWGFQGVLSYWYPGMIVQYDPSVVNTLRRSRIIIVVDVAIVLPGNTDILVINYSARPTALENFTVLHSMTGENMFGALDGVKMRKVTADDIVFACRGGFIEAGTYYLDFVTIGGRD